MQVVRNPVTWLQDWPLMCLFPGWKGDMLGYTAAVSLRCTLTGSTEVVKNMGTEARLPGSPASYVTV